MLDLKRQPIKHIPKQRLPQPTPTASPTVGVRLSQRDTKLRKLAERSRVSPHFVTSTKEAAELYNSCAFESSEYIANVAMYYQRLQHAGSRKLSKTRFSLLLVDDTQKVAAIA